MHTGALLYRGRQTRTDRLRDGHRSAEPDELHADEQGDAARAHARQRLAGGREGAVAREVRELARDPVREQRVAAHVPAARAADA